MGPGRVSETVLEGSSWPGTRTNRAKRGRPPAGSSWSDSSYSVLVRVGVNTVTPNVMSRTGTDPTLVARTRRRIAGFSGVTHGAWVTRVSRTSGAGAGSAGGAARASGARTPIRKRSRLIAAAPL